MKNISTNTLPNGLRIMYIHFPSIDSVYVSALGEAGALAESLKNVGVAHILEHCVFDGTAKYPSNKALTSQIDAVGGYINARTSFSDVEYYVRLLREDIEVGFDVLSQIVLYPNLSARTLRRERKVVREEVLRQRESELSKFGDAISKRHYPDQRFGLDIGGRLYDISKMRLQDVVAFHENFYVAKNFVIGVIGNISETAVLELANKYFGSMKSGEAFEPPEILRIKGPDFYVKKDKKAEQATLKIRFPAPIYTEDNRFPAKFLSLVLGEGFNSRLFAKLRTELGYVYSVDASYQPGLQIGTFVISMKLSEKNIASAIQVVKEEIKKVREELVADDEFHRALKVLLTSQVFHFEDPGSVLDFYSNQYLRGLYPEYDYPRMLERYRHVTKDAILQVANEIFSLEPLITLYSRNTSASKLEGYWY